ncbi:MAG: protein kinase [Desulfomonile tiedjei]|nr:protein kinase [Desulfomonile tiedjei]
MSNPEPEANAKGMSQPDLKFLIRTPFFDAIPKQAKFHLLAAMQRETARAGERFITQGHEGDCFYVIQDGTCAVTLEKDGAFYPLAISRAGDTVGEMAVLTGEIRSAHVDAQTDMTLWRIGREKFEKICAEYPEVRHFLTGIVTGRFARSRVTADRTVGKYVINEVVGQGGWSMVYKGRHTSLEMPVAIKMLKHNLAMEPAFLDQFRYEARTIASLNHQNIVKVYDIEELFRTVFIIMEYLEGISVEKMLKGMERVPISQAVNLLLQVCAGLAYAHERGIVHRDIKPANICVQPDGTAKILDFGLACAPGTSYDRIEGTPLYVSPEQIKGRPVDERSDIYSLGIAFYKIITGQNAFYDKDVSKLLSLHLFEDIRDPRSAVPDLPEELHRFLTVATRKEPEARYQNVNQIIHDLQPLAQKLGILRSTTPAAKFNMISLFLFYRDEHQAILKKLVDDFGQELTKIGAVLREADFKDVQKEPGDQD